MKITIPTTPPSINQYQHWHWAEKRKEKQYWCIEIWALLKLNGHPKNCRHINVSADIYFTTNRRRDSQNYASTLYKFLDDALVTAGVIPDDTAEYISHDEPVLSVGDKAETVIEIRESDGDVYRQTI